MAVLKQIREPQPLSGGFPDIMESTALLARSLKGKTLVFCIDARDFDIESRALGFTVFRQLQAGGASKALSYADFFSGAEVVADILLLRSSRMFAFRLDSLKSALTAFRKRNPNSAVIVSAFDISLHPKLKPLVDDGTINVLDDGRSEDIPLLSQGVQTLEAANP